MADTDTATIFGQLRSVIPAEHHGLLADVIAHMSELNAENMRFRKNMVAEIERGRRDEKIRSELMVRIGMLRERAGFYKNDARLKQEEINRLRNQLATSDRRWKIPEWEVDL